MAKKSATKSQPKPAAVPPTIHKAMLGKMGEVTKGPQLALSQAIQERQQGMDVVVCGSVLLANMTLAQQIEGAATGNRQIHHAAHASAGPNALSHFQPRNRPPQGHTFYENPPKRTAK